MFGWITDLLYGLLSWINDITFGIWGISIIVFTILVRLCMTPLDIKSRASMRKTMKLQPQLQALQKKYANDKEKLNAKTAELYKKAHVNPLSSCLPMLLTWPILIAVFGAMRTASNHEMLTQVGQILNGEEAQMEQFLWIRNLWMPDNPTYTALPTLENLRMVPTADWQTWLEKLPTLYNGQLPLQLQSFTAEWFESLHPDVLKNVPDDLKNILIGGGVTPMCFEGNNLQPMIMLIVEKMKTYPYYSQNITPILDAAGRPAYQVPLVGWAISMMNNGYLLLPILSAVSQLAMTKIMNGSTPQPQAVEGQPNTGKFMKWFFPLFSLWICIGYSAAFALYWVAGNLVSIGQTFLINKYLDSKEKNAGPVAAEGSVR